MYEKETISYKTFVNYVTQETMHQRQKNKYKYEIKY